MFGRNIVILLAATGFLALPAGARADIIVLKSGRELQGRPVRVGEMLRIELRPGATVIVRQDQVREIRPGTWKDEYLRRRAALKAPDARGRYQLAVWCRNKKLITQYEAELKAILKLEPGHDGALYRLEKLREDRAAAEERARVRARAKPASASADGLAHFSSRHIAVASDGVLGSAEGAAREGEKAVKRFTKLLDIAESDRDLKRFRVRLRVYHNAKEFKKAAQRAGVSGNAGFYSSGKAACHVLAKSDGTLRPENLRTVRHEVTHALVWRVLGISARDPWLHEALATIMEAEGESGIARKRLWFLTVKAADAEINVAGLYASKFSKGSLSERLICYARVWSFAHFMLYGGDEKRRKTFLAFLSDARGWKTDIREAFERHFPERQKLEREWRVHVNGLIAKHMPARLQKTVPEPAPVYDSPRRRTAPPRRTDDAESEKPEAEAVRPEDAAVKPAPIPLRRGGLWTPARRRAR